MDIIKVLLSSSMEKHLQPKNNTKTTFFLKVIFASALNLYSLSAWTENVFTQHFKTTYDKYLAKALAGDTKAQNLLGYMNFYGEAAVQDYDQAHYWFHLGAEAGDVQAQRNLGLFHARATKRIPEYYFDANESNMWLTKANSSTSFQIKYSVAMQEQVQFFSEGTPIEIGEKIYHIFCSGCHGFNGIASYEKSPSFAKGERLDKTEQQLFNSIKNGKSIMPAWQHVLSDQQITNVLAYINSSFSSGLNSSFNSVKKQSAVSQYSPLYSAHPADSLGAKTYARFCAGCHGFNGIAYYVNSPSFALGERMKKSNSALKKSIQNGRNVMPGWQDKLSYAQINALVGYIRTLSLDFDVGIEREINTPTNFYYQFKPHDGR